MIPSANINLDEYAISSEHGFLPVDLPLQQLPNSYYAPWENLAVRLPSLIQMGQIRSLIDDLPTLDTTLLQTEPEWRRAYTILGFLAHAYVWGGEKPRDHLQVLPPCISKPFLEVAAHFELPPCATYAGLTLWNYTSTTPDADISDPDNVSLVTSFTGTKDEEWFIVISVAIEENGGKLVSLMLDAIAAATAHDVARLTALLYRFTDGLQEVNTTLKRMYEKCSPSVFFHQLRPFLAGSKNMAAAGLPHGVFYDVGEGQGEWHQYSGGSNAQSSLIQMFDIFLGVNHSATGDIRPSGTGYIQEMRRYMPAPHRRFLETLSSLSNIRACVMSSQAESPLKEAYNAAVLMLSAFRETHIQIVTRYIVMEARSQTPSQRATDRVNLATASSQVKGLQEKTPSGLYGTGGTSLIPFLKQTRDTTKSATC
ncbi:Indoleamine 2-3-dioxygenase [Penicillium hispanicum]|uniref:Indoleamine 2-3-dioxygenase n=1 Tax=Penicillium hispanicum TaxID=1080232 RepID=UPI0025401CAA|nr:Indoleamine 2-3-dioxygenase [Penicillium hispanicum]KAJ5584186.1 Indoleamine 2-3-dioxygenase [Penicillium hispanicum]